MLRPPSLQAATGVVPTSFSAMQGHHESGLGLLFLSIGADSPKGPRSSRRMVETFRFSLAGSWPSTVRLSCGRDMLSHAPGRVYSLGSVVGGPGHRRMPKAEVSDRGFFCCRYCLIGRDTNGAERKWSEEGSRACVGSRTAASVRVGTRRVAMSR